MGQDLLNEALTVIRNAETSGKNECLVPVSETIKNVLLVMQKNGYIGNFESVGSGKSAKFRIELIMKLNNCGAISPRFSIGVREMEKHEIIHLPAKDFGILILSTSKGIMDHKEARGKKIGGKLISFVY